MSSSSPPFVAEICIFACNFAPSGWALCNGQLLPIAQNTALFSLLGTTFGGNGTSVFALPNLQGAVPVHVGGNQPGPGLQTWELGQSQGTETFTLDQTRIPSHAHGLFASNNDAANANPNGLLPAKGGWDDGSNAGVIATYSPNPPAVEMHPNALLPTGGSQPHNNLMPYVTLNFCIALQGVFPQRP